MWNPGHLPPHLVLTLSVGKPQARGQLTRLERGTARLLSLGCTLGQIGAILRLPVDDVRGLRRRVMHKIGTTSLATLTRYTIRRGISSLEDRLSDQERRLI